MPHLLSSVTIHLRNVFPLIDLGWDRARCVEHHAERGFERPSSPPALAARFTGMRAGVGCATTTPAAGLRAITFDNAIRDGYPHATTQGQPLRGQYCLHRCCQPLDHVDLHPAAPGKRHLRLVTARYPAPLDPEIGQPDVWPPCGTPKYLGRQVWGHRRDGRRAPGEAWAWSPVWAHPPIVSTEEFVAAQRRTRLATALPITDTLVAGRADRRGGVMTNPDFFTDHHLTTGHDLYPDGSTSQAITALQRDVDRNLRREGYPVPDGPRPIAPRDARGPVEPSADQTSEPKAEPASAETTRSPESCAARLPDAPAQPGATGAADNAEPSAGEPAGDPPPPELFTPAQAAERLRVRESWLRRRAARRLVPCTFLGKHLRFSRANLEQIIAGAARPAATNPRPSPGASTPSRRRPRPPARARTRSHRPSR